MSIDVAGRYINLAQLQTEMAAAGVQTPNGLLYVGPSSPTPSAVGAPLATGTLLFMYDDQNTPTDLPTGAAAVVDAHVAMRDKTDAELAAEFQNPDTTAVRKQEIRDMQSGLLPREQVPM
jgi:hypothetical protein